jgi:outer membrane immunogenic protein
VGPVPIRFNARNTSRAPPIVDTLLRLRGDLFGDVAEWQHVADSEPVKLVVLGRFPMNKFWFAGAILALSGAPTLAADMAVKARPMSAPIQAAYNWTGFYVGLNGGYGWGNASSTNDPVDPASIFFFGPGPGIFIPSDLNSSFRQSGAIAGGQAGYNWQFNSVVVGIESDLQWSNVRGSDLHTKSFNGDAMIFDAERRLEWFGTLRARLGFLAAPNLLIYGTGGLAYGETWAHGDVSFANPFGPTNIGVGINGVSLVCQTQGPPSPCYTGTNRETSVGWSAGAGAEYLFTANWTAKLEYLHVDLPGNSVTLISPSPPSSPGVSMNGRFNHQAYDFVRFGFNYKFGASGGAVVAKY